MKNISLNLLFYLLLFSVISVNAQTYTTTHKILMAPDATSKTYTLNPDKSIGFDVAFDHPNYPTRKKIRVVGGVQMPEPFSRRGEQMFR
ncbi:MAG: hypothetical protein RR388_07170, partial [Rikenellaceae bacterium]